MMHVAAVLLWVAVILAVLAIIGVLLWEVGKAIVAHFQAEAQLRRYAQQRQRELLHEKIAMSNEAMRLMDEFRRRTWR